MLPVAFEVGRTPFAWIGVAHNVLRSAFFLTTSLARANETLALSIEEHVSHATPSRPACPALARSRTRGRHQCRTGFAEIKPFYGGFLKSTRAGG